MLTKKGVYITNGRKVVIKKYNMQTRFKKNAKIFDIVITAVAGMVSVGVMLYSIGLLRNGNKTSKIKYYIQNRLWKN